MCGGSGKTYEFCTHWRGYTGSSWQPVSNFILPKANSNERVVQDDLRDFVEQRGLDDIKRAWGKLLT